MGLWYTSLMCLLLGILTLAAGYIARQINERQDEWGGHAAGKVVELSLRPAADPEGQFRDRYYPVIEFYAKGRLFRVELPDGSWPSVYHINQEIRIDYDPDDPEKCQIGEPDVKAYLPAVLYGAGSVLLLASVLIFLRYAVRA